MRRVNSNDAYMKDIEQGEANTATGSFPQNFGSAPASFETYDEKSSYHQIPTASIDSSISEKIE